MALILKLKISLVENESIYRVIEIGGNETFERLADTILDAFAFAPRASRLTMGYFPSRV